MMRLVAPSSWEARSMPEAEGEQDEGNGIRDASEGAGEDGVHDLTEDPADASPLASSPTIARAMTAAQPVAPVLGLEVGRTVPDAAHRSPGGARPPSTCCARRRAGGRSPPSRVFVVRAGALRAAGLRCAGRVDRAAAGRDDAPT